jgi:PIN domain nuclease of toxin-antitoxin system
MLAAQCALESMTLISWDRVFLELPTVRVVW